VPRVPQLAPLGCRGCRGVPPLAPLIEIDECGAQQRYGRIRPSKARKRTEPPSIRAQLTGRAYPFRAIL